MESLASQAKPAAVLWLAGFLQAARLHRVVFFCASSRPLSIRIAQCFLLNGFIFLGSLLTLKSVVIPTILWILPEECDQLRGHLCDHTAAVATYSFLRSGLVEIFYVFWFYPLYIFSFIISTLWYGDIAKHALDVVKSKKLDASQAFDADTDKTSESADRPEGFDGLAIGVGEQVYSILLLTILFAENVDLRVSAIVPNAEIWYLSAIIFGAEAEVYVIILASKLLNRGHMEESPFGLLPLYEMQEKVYQSATPTSVTVVGYIPYLGKAMNFLLLSLMYAYYCFEYKWNFFAVSLNHRLDFFESNWAFFAGFGSPCVLPIFFLSPLASYGVMAILYPLFVMTAAGTQAEQEIDELKPLHGGKLKRIPLFFVAKRLATQLLELFPEAQKEQ